MRKILQLFIVALVAFSCGSNGNVNKSKGEVVGVKGNKYYAEKPFGMVLVPGGSFIMGKSDDDMPSIQDAPTKTVTVRSFYMDETEITNAEYRQFVRWVRDSVIRTALAEQFRDRDDIGPESEYFQYLYKSEKAIKESDDEAAVMKCLREELHFSKDEASAIIEPMREKQRREDTDASSTFVDKIKKKLRK